MEAIAILCANRDCNIAEDGKCVEGLAREVCPNFGKAPPSAANDVEQAADDAWQLSHAGRLSVEEATAILRRNDTRLVAIIGPHDAGKTSLIAGLFELFQKGRIDGNQFAGSHTLHAFEIACHDSRAASDRQVPDSHRTPLGEVQFFHLDVVRIGDQRVSLLLGDRAGEEYRTAANDVQVVASFPELQRAETVTLLVDGSRLLSTVLRHQTRNEALRIVQAAVDGGGTNGRQRLAIALTKLDEIKSSGDKARVFKDFDDLVAQLQENFVGRFVRIEAFQLAASPKKDTVPAGTGLDALLAFWLQPSEAVQALPVACAASERVFRRLRVETVNGG